EHLISLRGAHPHECSHAHGHMHLTPHLPSRRGTVLGALRFAAEGGADGVGNAAVGQILLDAVATYLSRRSTVRGKLQEGNFRRSGRQVEWTGRYGPRE